MLKLLCNPFAAPFPRKTKVGHIVPDAFGSKQGCTEHMAVSHVAQMNYGMELGSGRTLSYEQSQQSGVLCIS